MGFLLLDLRLRRTICENLASKTLDKNLQNPASKKKFSHFHLWKLRKIPSVCCYQSYGELAKFLFFKMNVGCVAFGHRIGKCGVVVIFELATFERHKRLASRRNKLKRSKKCLHFGIVCFQSNVHDDCFFCSSGQMNWGLLMRWLFVLLFLLL